MSSSSPSSTGRVTHIVCFDVLGTCFDFEPVISTIRNSSSLSPGLARAGIDARSLFWSWFYAGQRDFTYVSLASTSTGKSTTIAADTEGNTYVPVGKILKSTFRRACLICGLTQDEVSDQVVEEVMHTFINGLQPRDGLKECWDGLRHPDATSTDPAPAPTSYKIGGEKKQEREEKGIKWEVLGVTNGAHKTSLDYYHRADISLDSTHLISCDDIKKAKPDIGVYDNAHKKLDELFGERDAGDGKRKQERWFVAAHAWDLLPARQAGFKTAWLGFEEHDPCTDVFGEFDIYAGSMKELLEKLSNV